MSTAQSEFYLSTLSGLQVSLDYSASRSVQSLRKEAEAALGCPGDIQLYSFQGILLRDEDILGRVGVKEGDRVQVLMRNPGLFQLFVNFNEQIFTLDVLPDETIESVLTCLRRVVKTDLTGAYLYKHHVYLTSLSCTLSQAGVLPLDQLILTFVK